MADIPMSNPSTPEVTRADREIAHEIMHHVHGYAVKLPDDRHWLIDLVARHRLAHSPARGGDELREALEQIAAAETQWANATVRKMASIARAALASTDMAGAGENVWDSYRLPCDVHLAPVTIIKAGCKLATLKVAMEVPHRPKHFEGHHNDALRSSVRSVEGLTSGEGEVEQAAISLIVDLCGAGASQSSTNLRVVEDHLRQFARALAASPKATATASVREDRVKLVASALCRAAGMNPDGGPKSGYGWRDHETAAVELLASLTDSGTAATIGGERA